MCLYKQAPEISSLFLSKIYQTNFSLVVYMLLYAAIFAQLNSLIIIKTPVKLTCFIIFLFKRILVDVLSVDELLFFHRLP